MNNDERKARLRNAIVSKDKRSEALAFARGIQDPERRSHAVSFIMSRTRTQDQIDSFIARMEAANG